MRELIDSLLKLNEETETLGSVIKSRRKELGLTTDALAQQIGVHRTWITKLERTNLLPSIKILSKLEDELGVDLKSVYTKGKLPWGSDDLGSKQEYKCDHCGGINYK